MAVFTSVGRKATLPEAQLLGVEPDLPAVWAPAPPWQDQGRPTTLGLVEQSKTSAGRLGRAGLPKPFIFIWQPLALLL